MAYSWGLLQRLVVKLCFKGQLWLASGFWLTVFDTALEQVALIIE